MEHDYEEDTQTAAIAEISLQVILGETSGTTTKLEGNIGIHQVIISINGGSAHNFIANVIIYEPGLLI